jgi:hypothetical protein
MWTAATAQPLHAAALEVMVSPSEDTNPGLPWFMAIDPATGHAYYVERRPGVVQWPDPSKQCPPPLVVLPPVNVLNDLLGLAAPTVVWPNGEVQHMRP